VAATACPLMTTLIGCDRERLDVILQIVGMLLQTMDPLLRAVGVLLRTSIHDGYSLTSVATVSAPAGSTTTGVSAAECGRLLGGKP
jgi:hypothetical protein